MNHMYKCADGPCYNSVPVGSLLLTWNVHVHYVSMDAVNSLEKLRLWSVHQVYIFYKHSLSSCMSLSFSLVLGSCLLLFRQHTTTTTTTTTMKIISITPPPLPTPNATASLFTLPAKTEIEHYRYVLSESVNPMHEWIHLSYPECGATHLVRLRSSYCYGIEWVLTFIDL